MNDKKDKDRDRSRHRWIIETQRFQRIANGKADSYEQLSRIYDEDRKK